MNGFALLIIFAFSEECFSCKVPAISVVARKAEDSGFQTAFKYIIEEVAYTWFNRLIAVRFMEVNDYLPSHIRVLSSEQGKIEPDLVTTPFDADFDFSRDEQQTIIELKNENKLDEVFRLLFIKQCNSLNEILPALFEKTNDYTELLLGLSVVDQDGIVYHLVHPKLCFFHLHHLLREIRIHGRSIDARHETPEVLRESGHRAACGKSENIRRLQRIAQIPQLFVDRHRLRDPVV